jgi:hypothetical protein
MMQVHIDNAELAWQNLCDEVKQAGCGDGIIDAMIDMGWTLEALVNACQSVVDEKETV